mgnify:FL=1
MIEDFVFALKYARYNEKEKRRESWSEAVDRYMGMIEDKYPLADTSDIRAAMDLKRVLPSMRGLQFGGAGVQRKNMRIYNCTSTYIDRPRAFAGCSCVGQE